jgi:hypothetical protein
VGERYVLEEMLGTFVTRPKPATALPLTNEPGQRDQFGSQVCGYLNRHSCYLVKQLTGAVLLLSFEEAVDHVASKPSHGKAGNAKQDKEENFICKYGHGAILTL